MKIFTDIHGKKGKTKPFQNPKTCLKTDTATRKRSGNRTSAGACYSTGKSTRRCTDKGSAGNYGHHNQNTRKYGG